MILKSGTFKTSDYRRSLPARARLDVMLRCEGRCECSAPVTLANCGHKLGNMDNVQFNHDPPLEMRDVDTEADNGRGDFIPSQFDTKTIFAVRVDCHAVHTSGAGATTRGSVVGERARTLRISKSFNDFKARRVPGAETPDAKPSRWPSRKMSSGRKFPTAKRAK